jgi:type IV secretory pathway VirB10-like protein
MKEQAMDKHTSQNAGTDRNTKPTSMALWWSDKHASAWGRAKEALRRDWEQTKADFSSHDGVELNQNVGDTVKQLAGAAPVPPLTVKTRPDEPQHMARRAEKELKERSKAQEKIAAAHTDMAVEQVRAEGKIAQERHEAHEKIAGEQQKLGEIATDARETMAKDEKKGQEKLAKQQEKIAEVRAEVGEKIAEVRAEVGEKLVKQQEKVAEARKDWSQIEPAVRYGYGARMEYADGQEWDELVEGRLRTGWAEMKTNNAWEEARPHVRHGWDSAR